VIAFFDTAIVVYAFTDGPKQTAARLALADGGVVSVQVLNEFANVMHRKNRRAWPEIEAALAVVCIRFPDVRPLTLETQGAALGLAREHGLSFYDALIVAAALEAGCDMLFSEDLQDGRAFGGLTIINPFRALGG
jgi:predicted nucleic acid-binding protein